MNCLLVGYGLIVLLTILGWRANKRSDDARAGYKGGEMMGAVIITVSSITALAIWTAVWGVAKLVYITILRFS